MVTRVDDTVCRAEIWEESRTSMVPLKGSKQAGTILSPISQKRKLSERGK